MFIPIITPFYRCLRHGYFRYLIKKQLRATIHQYLTISPEGQEKYEMLLQQDIERFRIKHQLTRGEIGIFLREFYWSDNGWLGIEPLFEHYSNWDILQAYFPKYVHDMNNLDEEFIGDLVDYLIQFRFYLYIKIIPDG